LAASRLGGFASPAFPRRNQREDFLPVSQTPEK